MAGSSSGVSDELAALEATRARLEAALSADENWRALKQARAENASPTDQRAQRRLRDARLELSLLSNPVYRAWKHVDDAIEVLRKNQETSGNTGALDSVHLHVSGNAAKEVTSLANLSRGIARLMQRRMPEADDEPALARLESLQAPTPAARPIEPAAFEDASVEAEAEIDAASHEQGISSMTAQESPPSTTAPPIAAQAASDVRPANAGASAPPRRASRPRPLDLDEPPFDPRFEPEEATVTFVTREPASPRRGSGERKPASPEPTVEPSAPVEADAAFSSGVDVEEAEVTILTPEDRKLQEETAQRDGNRRRFRKALLGD